MTLIAAFPRCRAELARCWSATDRDNARRLRQRCRPSTPVPTAFDLHLSHQSGPLPLAEYPTNHRDGSRAYHAGPCQRPNLPSAFNKQSRSHVTRRFVLGGLPDAGPSQNVVRRRPEPFTQADTCAQISRLGKPHVAINHCQGWPLWSPLCYNVSEHDRRLCASP
jgi:hypothetical protein